MKYDTIIVGAGLSGLAAGIRLAHYGKKVCILERHSLIGGLNSFYRKGGREFDVGLHAVTNFAEPTLRRAPLNKLLRQLRIPHKDLQICEQDFSVISFPDCELKLDNSFENFQASVAAAFPNQIAGFKRLVELVKNQDALSLQAEPLSTREVLDHYISDKKLQSMILCPVMYYGNANEYDMDFNQFCIMFRSIFLEGFWRPRNGVRPFLELLRQRFLESGGELRMNCGVRNLQVTNNSVSKIELENGGLLEADNVLSSAGFVETMRLCQPAPHYEESLGRMSFTETIFVLDKPARDLGLNASITFFSREEGFNYVSPKELLNSKSGVLCVPENFCGMEKKSEGQVRLTHQAGYDQWRTLDKQEYLNVKQQLIEQQLHELERFAPNIRQHLVATDMFTPLTVERFTGHINGAVYGSPKKHRNGRTPVNNLFICGTDQGFLGIVGAMLSGVSIANLYLLR